MKSKQYRPANCAPTEVSLTIAEYGIIGTSTVVDCVARVGITDADEVPHLNIYRGSFLLFQTAAPDLFGVSIVLREYIGTW